MNPTERPDGAVRSGRAAPMEADERRAAILAATVPLLRDRGVNVTTRELASAAGVAEGTLFRVFADKEALIGAAIAQALDPGPTLAAMSAIDRGLDLRTTLLRAVELILARSRDVAVLLSVSHDLASGMPPHGRHMRPHGHHPIEMVAGAVAGLLAPHRARLRLDVTVCARMLVGIVFATTRPLSDDTAPALTPEQIVGLFLDGALSPSTSVPETSC